MIRRLFIASAFFYLLNFIASGVANADIEFSRYEKQNYWFSVMYPKSWKIEESKIERKYTVKFLSLSGNIAVAVKNPESYHVNTFKFIKESNLSELQLQNLAHEMYSNVPGVLDAKVFVTTLSNEKALGSIYFYKLDTLGLTLGYTRVFKLETMHMNKFYKLEFTTQLYESPQLADQALERIWPIVQTVAKSFVFLPY